MAAKYVYKNSNGNDYAILEKYGDKALLKNLESGEVVIAHGFSKDAPCWGCGSYWGQNLVSAMERFKELISEEG